MLRLPISLTEEIGLTFNINSLSGYFAYMKGECVAMKN